MRRKIGVFRLTEPREFTNHYETAAWYQTILVEPGDYDVFLYTNGYPWVTVSMEGRVVKSDFTSLFGGVAFGKPKIDEDKGEIRKHVMQYNAYNIARYALDNHPNWVLDSDVAVVEKTVESFTEPGRMITIARLVVDGKEY